MGKWIHKTLEVRESTVVCANCGEVPSVLQKGKPRCSIAVKEQRGTLEYQKTYNRTKRRETPSYYKYGGSLTLKERDKLIEEHEGRCGICGDVEDLVIDHCHATNKIRGALCSSCNIGLGMFKDDVERLKKAIDYLA